MDMKVSKKTKSLYFGITLIELLIGVMIVSILAIITMTQTSQLSSFFLKTMKSVDNDTISYKELIQDFETSYLMKLGYLNCINSNSVMATDNWANFSFSEELNEFDIISVDYTSIAGFKSTEDDGNLLALSNVSLLKKGDYLVVFLSSDISFASLYKIKDIKTEDNSISIEPVVFSVEGFNCTSSFVNRNILDFFGPSIKSNVLAARIKPVKYFLKDKELRRKVEGSKDGQLLFEGVSYFNISSEWRNYSPEKISITSGSMNFEMKFEIKSSEIVKNVSKKLGEQQFGARYILESTGFINNYSVVGAPSIAVPFPSCAVNYEFKNDILKINPENDWWRNMTTFVLKGEISSSVVGANIIVDFSPGSGAAISCFLHNPKTEKSYPKDEKFVTNPGEQVMLTLAQKIGGFDVYTCAARGFINVTANMSYYDSQTDQLKNIQCSSDEILAASQFQFTGDNKPSCKKEKKKGERRIKLNGKIRGVDQETTFGGFWLDHSTGCEWEGGPDKRNTGLASSCDDDWSFITGFKKLKRVYLRPYRVDVLNKDGKTLFTKKEGAYVDCY